MIFTYKDTKYLWDYQLFMNKILSRTGVIILLHQSQLDINRAVGTSRSRYRVFRRHRCRRYGVREDLCSHPKGADEAMRNRRWYRWLLPTKEKPLSYFGWAQDKGFKTLNNLFDWYTTKVALSFITTSIKLFRI